MALKSFKELLLRRASDNSALQELIKSIPDAELIDQIISVLEKTDDAPADHKAWNANNAVTTFAKTFHNPEAVETEMIRDALGHHVSHYKAALKANNKDLAKKHAQQAFKLMDLVATVGAHTGGNLGIKYVNPRPWERNSPQYSERIKDPNDPRYGEFRNKAKNLNLWHKLKDYDVFQEPPHHKELGLLDSEFHNKAYPFEAIAIKNHGKTHHIHVDHDLKSPGTYQKHEFDHHPIVEHFKQPKGSRTEKDERDYVNAVRQYEEELPHINKFQTRHDALAASDPNYKNRGLERSAQPVHLETKPIRPEVAASQKHWAEHDAAQAKPKHWRKMPEEMRPTTPVKVKEPSFDPSVYLHRFKGSK